MTEGVKIVADDIEINHQAGTVRTSGSEKVANTLRGHVNSLFNSKSSGKDPEDKGRRSFAQVPAGGDPGTVQTREAQIMNQCCERSANSALSAMDWRENPNRTSGNEGVPLQ